MHNTQFLHMARCIEKYMPNDRTYQVVELGSRNPRASDRTHRSQLNSHDVRYLGVDLLPGYNVDLVMEKPYEIPVPSKSVDVLMAGAVFEHVPFVWVTMLEVARVLKPGGYAFVIAPSRGHEHNVYDPWRYYPDSYRALAAWSGCELAEVFADLPPRLGTSWHHDYRAIDADRSYWGDTVAVFRRPTAGYPELKIAALRRACKLWANIHPDLEAVPRPPVDAAREKIHGR